MRLEPFIPGLLGDGILSVDFSTGEIFSTNSNTPEKPLGSLTKKGYVRVCLNINGKQAHALAHRIVWIAAHGAIPEGVQIDHKNTIKTDNRLDNLENVTGAENMRRAAVMGLTNGGWRNGPRDSTTGQFLKKRDGRTWEEMPEVGR